MKKTHHCLTSFTWGDYKWVIVVLYEFCYHPFTRLVILNMNHRLTTFPCAWPWLSNLSEFPSNANTIAFLITPKSTGKNPSISFGTSARHNTHDKPHPPCIFVIEYLGSIFRIKFHTFTRFWSCISFIRNQSLYSRTLNSPSSLIRIHCIDTGCYLSFRHKLKNRDSHFPPWDWGDGEKQRKNK